MSTMMLAMPGTEIERWCEAARARWPQLAWSIERFAVYVGHDRPSHPLDLYLSGAAAERAHQAWEIVHQETFQSVVARLSKKRFGPESDGLRAEDLYGEVLAAQMADDPAGSPLPGGAQPARIGKFRGNSSLATYFFVCARNLAVDLIRRRTALDVTPEGAWKAGATFDPDDGGRSAPTPGGEERDALARALVQAWRALPPRQKGMFDLCALGMPIGRAGRLCGLNPSTATRTLQDARARIEFQVQSAGFDRSQITAEVIQVLIQAIQAESNQPPFTSGGHS